MAKRKSSRRRRSNTTRKRNSRKTSRKPSARSQSSLRKMVGNLSPQEKAAIGAIGTGVLAVGSAALARYLRNKQKLQQANDLMQRNFPKTYKTLLNENSKAKDVVVGVENVVMKVVDEIARERGIEKPQLAVKAQEVLDGYIASVPLSKYREVLETCTIPERVYLKMVLEDMTGRPIEYNALNDQWKCLDPRDRPLFVQKFKERVVASQPGFERIFKRDLLARENII